MPEIAQAKGSLKWRRCQSGTKRSEEKFLGFPLFFSSRRFLVSINHPIDSFQNRSCSAKKSEEVEFTDISEFESSKTTLPSLSTLSLPALLSF